MAESRGGGGEAQAAAVMRCMHVSQFDAQAIGLSAGFMLTEYSKLKG